MYEARKRRDNSNKSISKKRELGGEKNTINFRITHKFWQGFCFSLLLFILIWAMNLKNTALFLYALHLFLIIVFDFTVGGLGWNTYDPAVGFQSPYPMIYFYMILILGTNTVAFSVVLLNIRENSPILFQEVEKDIR